MGQVGVATCSQSGVSERIADGDQIKDSYHGRRDKGYSGGD